MTHPKDQIDTEALRLCAPAPGTDDEPRPEPGAEDDGLDDLCERWASWCQTRRFYVAPPVPNILGRMRGNSRPLRPGGPDAEISAELEWLERDLRRRREKLRFWARHKRNADGDPTYPEDMRLAAYKWHAQAESLVASGERVRSYLLLQLKDQPEYAPAYHYSH